MELDSVAKHRYAFYRLCGSKGDDEGLTEQGESTDDVAYLYLTAGYRRAQQFLLDEGLWLRPKRSSALSWSGADSTDGGRYASLPTDFLRADGNRKDRSALVEAGGDGWGTEVLPSEAEARGDGYYFTDSQVWLCRDASPPSTLYLRYFQSQSAFSASLTSSDFLLPVDCRGLGVAYAAEEAKDEGWFPLGSGADAKIMDAVRIGELKAKKHARRSKAPREIRGRTVHGNRW